MMIKHLLRVEDVATKCQVSKQSVYKAIECGLLRARRFGRSVRVSEDDLDQYLERDQKQQEGGGV